MKRIAILLLVLMCAAPARADQDLIIVTRNIDGHITYIPTGCKEINVKEVRCTNAASSGATVGITFGPSRFGVTGHIDFDKQNGAWRLKQCRGMATCSMVGNTITVWRS